MSGFEPKILSLQGKPVHPSIPLLIPKTYDWNMDENRLSKREPNKEHIIGSMKLVDEAMQLIHSIDKPIAILSICGPYRTGKSYLMSRILGCSDAFSLGHSFDACTKGVWMSTTVLECDSFVVLFLDTEGTDVVHSSDNDDGTCTMEQLSIIILISSLLIYNSSQVPEWSDLDDLSFLSSLSSSLITSSSDEQSSLSSYFPHFIWLIRDHALEITDEKNQPIMPTEYLKTQVLVRRDKGRETDQDCVIKAINSLFPSIECHTLPRPSTEESILTSIVTNEDRLNSEFTSELVAFRALVLEKLETNMRSDQRCKNGLVMTELLTSYVNLVNSGSRIALQDVFTTAVEGFLLSRLEVLTNEYQCEMEHLLNGRYPMEECILNEMDEQPEITLMETHNKVMESKKGQFQRELDTFLPAGNTAINHSLMSQFIDDICRMTQHGNLVKFEGGKLYQFVLDNLNASKRFCEDLSLKVFSDVTQQIEKAIVTRIPVDLSDKFLLAERQYYRKAVGPAKHEVYNNKRKELGGKCEAVSLIPDLPFGLYVSGRDRNRVKLQWVGIDGYNYEVQYMSDSTNWITLSEKHQQSAIIENLEASSDYIFRVRATSETRGDGHWSDTVSTKTTTSLFLRGAATVGTFLGVTMASPALALLTIPGGPLSVMAGLVLAPVGGTFLAKKVAKHYGPTGDLADENREEKSRIELKEFVSAEVEPIQAADDSEESGMEHNSALSCGQ